MERSLQSTSRLLLYTDSPLIPRHDQTSVKLRVAFSHVVDIEALLDERPASARVFGQAIEGLFHNHRAQLEASQRPALAEGGDEGRDLSKARVIPSSDSAALDAEVFEVAPM